MSPLAIFLRDVRVGRGLRQKQMAALLGYEQSYLSALELGIKGPPRRDFLDRLMQKLHLDDEEISRMNFAAARSKRRLVVPLDAAEAEYDLCYRLVQQLGRLKPTQIELILLALRMFNPCAVDLAEPSTSMRLVTEKRIDNKEGEIM